MTDQPTVTPDDLTMPDWGTVPDPTQDRTTEEVEADEPPARH